MSSECQSAAGARGGMLSTATDRRSFLRLAALGSTAVMLPGVIACDSTDTLDPAATAKLDFSTETGAVNLAYAMEQVQFQFYQRISTYQTFTSITRFEFNGVFNITAGIQPQQTAHLNVIRAQQQFDRIPDFLNVPFTGYDFSRREDVFTLGIALEDLSAAMYPGLIPYATSDKWRTLFAKMGSAEARHSAALRDMADIYAGRSDTSARTSFAGDDIVSPTTGRGRVATPSEVVAALRQYVSTDLQLSGV